MHKIAWDVYVFSKPDSAFYFAQMEYELAEATGNKEWMVRASNIQGVSFGIRGNYKEALIQFQKCLNIQEEIGDKRSLAPTYNNIGLIYDKLGNYEQALAYHQKSLKIAEETGDKKGMAMSYNNIGVICKMKGNYEQALAYFQRGLTLDKEIDNERGLAESYRNIGLLYKDQGNTKEVLLHLQKSLKLYVEVGDKRGMSSSYKNLGDLYLDQGNYTQALDMGKKALVLAQEVGVVIEIKLASALLYDIYKKTGQPVKALEIQELYITMNDSLNSIENRDAAIKLEYQYKYEKEQAVADAKHKEEMSLSAEREKRQQLISYGTGAGLILVLVFAFLIFNRFKLTREQKKVIEQKNNHITESIRYAKRIQDASLVSKQNIDKALDDYFIYFKPKDIVSGDFYWVHEIDKDKVMVAVCDCTGHGIPGAFMSMISTSLLNEIIIENGVTQVNAVLDTMRTQLIKVLHQHEDNVETMDGLDISLLLVDKKNRKIDFAGAGHKLYITGKEGCKEIKGNYYPVGYLFGREKPFTMKKLQLEDGETIYLTSDGFTDQFGGKNRTKFGRPAFKQLLISIKDEAMAEQKTIVEKTMAKWKGDTEQVDDILVMGVRV